MLNIHEKHEENKIQKTLKLVPMTDKEMCEADIPEPKWFFPMLMPKPGMVFLTGKPGAGKTMWAMWMARRISSGLPLFNVCESQPQFGLGEGHIPTRVLFIEEEMSHIHLKERGNQMFRYEESDKNLIWWINSGMKLKEVNHMKQLVEFVAANGIQVIFMDPFSSVAGMIDENSNAEAAVVMDMVRDLLVEEVGCAVVFIHHPAKDDAGSSSVRGAGDMTGKCDLGLKLESISDDQLRLKISYIKKRIIPQNTRNFIVEMREGIHSEFAYLSDEKEWSEMTKTENSQEWSDKVRKESEKQKALYGKYSLRSIETALGVSRGHSLVALSYKKLQKDSGFSRDV